MDLTSFTNKLCFSDQTQVLPKVSNVVFYAQHPLIVEVLHIRTTQEFFTVRRQAPGAAWSETLRLVSTPKVCDTKGNKRRLFPMLTTHSTSTNSPLCAYDGNTYSSYTTPAASWSDPITSDIVLVFRQFR